MSAAVLMGFWDSTSSIHFILSPLAGMYALGWWAYEGLYRAGIKKTASPHGLVICVGNLQVGGLGKTPLTIGIADFLVSSGYEVVIGASGYGSPRSAEATIAPEGELKASEWGDEPAVIRDCLPGLHLVVGRDRVMAARLVHESFPKAILIMDDGFQHLPLHKDVSIVIEPDGRLNPFCLPIGPYREPRTGLARADYRVESVGNVLTIETGLSPDANMTGQDAQILTSIANPERFITTVESIVRPGTIVWQRLQRDHEPLQVGNLFDGFERSRPIFVTAKDWVKLRERPDLASWEIIVVRQHVVLSDPALKEFLLRKIDEIAPQAT